MDGEEVADGAPRWCVCIAICLRHIRVVCAFWAPASVRRAPRKTMLSAAAHVCVFCACACDLRRPCHGREYKSERCARQASGFLMAAGVAAAALAGRAILRQARGGQGMGAMFQSFTGAGSVGGAMKVRLCQRGQLHVRAAPVLTSLCRALHKPPRGSTLVL